MSHIATKLLRWNFLTMSARQWWHMPLVPALRRQRQVDFWEFEASLFYRVSSRTGLKKKKKAVSYKNLTMPKTRRV